MIAMVVMPILYGMQLSEFLRLVTYGGYPCNPFELIRRYPVSGWIWRL